MGVLAKKVLGQHFLKDESLIEKIVFMAGFRSSDCVLEIGPGRGALTIPVAAAAGSVTAVEKDEALADELTNKLSRAGVLNVRVVKADILKWDFEEMPCERFHVIGNLPYYVSKPVLEKLISNRKRVLRAIVMLQREVAERLTASPGSRQYGALSLMAQYHAKTRMLLNISSSAFFPMPKVESAVVELDFERPYPKRYPKEDFLFKVIKGAFSHRRKTVFNSLQRYFPDAGKSSIARALELACVPPSARAETLSMEDFMRLAATMDLTINQYPCRKTNLIPDA
jgi:16S rRNA (adenine1518-N6/adenine1519-N6)-dimethyltransferase